MTCPYYKTECMGKRVKSRIKQYCESKDYYIHCKEFNTLRNKNTKKFFYELELQSVRAKNKIGALLEIQKFFKFLSELPVSWLTDYIVMWEEVD